MIERAENLTNDVVRWLNDMGWPAVAEDLSDYVRSARPHGGAHGAATVLSRFLELGTNHADDEPPWTRDVIGLFAAFLWTLEVARATHSEPDFETLDFIEGDLRTLMVKPWKLTPGTDEFNAAVKASLERASEALRAANELIEEDPALIRALVNEGEWPGCLDRFDSVFHTVKEEL